MAHGHIAVALGAACFALLVLFQLVSTFGFPQVGFLNFHYAPVYAGSSNQIPIEPELPSDYVSRNGSPYLLGVGKADITGYVPLCRKD